MSLAGTLLMLCSYCANMKAPGGGPEDIYPPIVVESFPPNYSTFFEAEKVILKFDEFVSVSDVSKEVFISPPLQTTPEIITRGKSVIITFNEALLDSTTYSIFFGNAIKDISEGNALENYNYVFSTGGKIDSLSVVGEVLDAFMLKPREAVLVMLYEDDNDTIPFDSLPYLVKPSYLTRTSAEGFFVINNLRGGEYALFALADNNMSATYDNEDEEIAFLDSLIAPEYLAPVPADSLLSDSLAVADSLTADLPLEDFYTLFMFKEVDSTQRLLEADKPRERLLRFIFRYPAADINIEPLTAVSEDWMLSEWNKGYDTLRYYIMDESMDTISLKISLDTIVFDTLSYSLNEEVLPQRKKDRKGAKALKVTASKIKPFPYYKKYWLTSGYPIIGQDFPRISLFEGEDTLSPEMLVYGQANRMLRLDHDLKEGVNYTLFLPDSVLYDLLGKSNDTTVFNFTTDAEEDYGVYTINITNNSSSENLIIQLLTENEKLLRSAFVQSEGAIRWDYLKPGKYLIKASGDLNGNGMWDTGDFLGRRQPEPVVFHTDILQVREAWSFDLEWSVTFK